MRAVPDLRVDEGDPKGADLTGERTGITRSVKRMARDAVPVVSFEGHRKLMITRPAW